MNSNYKKAKVACQTFCKEQLLSKLPKWNSTNRLINQAYLALRYGTNSDEDYPGFTTAIKEIREFFRSLPHTHVYFTLIGECTQWNRPPQFIWITVPNAECEFCNRSIRLSPILKNADGTPPLVYEDGSPVIEEVRCIDGSEHSLCDGYRIRDGSIEMEMENDEGYLEFSIIDLMVFPDLLRHIQA